MSQNPSDPTRSFDPPVGGPNIPGPGSQSPGYQTPGYQASTSGSPLAGQAGTGTVGADERTMMLIAHLSAPAAMLLSVGWLPFLGPLLVWLFYKDRSRAVRQVAAGAFNFNVSLTIVSVLTWISVILTLGIGFLWAIPIWIALFVVQIWVHVKGAMQASRGEVYEYPFQLRILS